LAVVLEADNEVIGILWPQPPRAAPTQQ